MVPRLSNKEAARPVWRRAACIGSKKVSADAGNIGGLERSDRITGGEDQSYFVDPHMQVRVLPVALRSQLAAWPGMTVA